MSSRKDEATATFKEENVTRETFVLFSAKDENFVLGRNEYLGDLKKGSPDIQINIDHRAKMRECLEPVAPGEVLCDLFDYIG